MPTKYFTPTLDKEPKKNPFPAHLQEMGSYFSSSSLYDTAGAAYPKSHTLSRLLYVVNSLGQTRDLSGCSILMINALGSSSINGGNSVLQSSNSSYGNGGFNAPAPSYGSYSAPSSPASDFAMLDDDDAQLPF